ncbi:MAG: hypothetical protein WCT07_01435 [Candidatus Paceibacterota bacterium]|jgi:hypothetical protein
MDESLFKKHIINIKRRKNNKEELILFIKEKTGVDLEETMITLSKKEVSFHLSSVVKQKLFQKNIEEILKQKGFTFKK